MALVALAEHGALYLAVKTEAELQGRSRMLARRLWVLLFVVTLVSLSASIIARADTLTNYKAYPIAFLVPVAVLLALLGMIQFSRKGADRNAFACSCLYLTLMLVGAALGLYPRLLPSTTGSQYDITVERALSGPHTLHVGLIWWAFGMCLALVYFIIVYRMFRGKVSLEGGRYGH